MELLAFATFFLAAALVGLATGVLIEEPLSRALGVVHEAEEARRRVRHACTLAVPIVASTSTAGLFLVWLLQPVIA